MEDESTAGKPCPGVSSRTHEIQVIEILRFVMRSEPGRLRQNWLYRERRSQIAVQLALEVQRVNIMFGHDIAFAGPEDSYSSRNCMIRSR